MDIKSLKENIEQISEEVHNAWMREKIEQGFHSPDECKVMGRTSSDGYSKSDLRGLENKRICKCSKCHADLYPYSELPENIKEYDRVTVRAVINAIEKIKEY